jgi:hypothetical protein
MSWALGQEREEIFLIAAGKIGTAIIPWQECAGGCFELRSGALQPPIAPEVKAMAARGICNLALAKPIQRIAPK